MHSTKKPCVIAPIRESSEQISAPEADQPEAETFRTKNIYLATIYLLSKIKLCRIENNSRTRIFIESAEIYVTDEVLKISTVTKGVQ
jgi:hypothetical protein